MRPKPKKPSRLILVGVVAVLFGGFGLILFAFFAVAGIILPRPLGDSFAPRGVLASLILMIVGAGAMLSQSRWSLRTQLIAFTIFATLIGCVALAVKK